MQFCKTIIPSARWRLAMKIKNISVLLCMNWIKIVSNSLLLYTVTHFSYSATPCNNMGQLSVPDTYIRYLNFGAVGCCHVHSGFGVRGKLYARAP